MQLGFLNVIVPADIVEVRGAEGTVEGGSARLTCKTEGYPRPRVYWQREDKQPIVQIDRATGLKTEST